MTIPTISCPPTVTGYANLIYYNRLAATNPPQCVSDCLHDEGSVECVAACTGSYSFHDKETNTCKTACGGIRPNYFIEPATLIKYCVAACNNTVKSNDNTNYFLFTDGTQCKQSCDNTTQFYKESIC